MCVTTGLESNEAGWQVRKRAARRELEGDGDLQYRDTHNGQESADVIDTRENLPFRKAFHARMGFGEVCCRKADEDNAVPNQRDPLAPSPRRMSREKLAVHDIGSERQDEAGHEGKRDPTLSDWDNIGDAAIHTKSVPVLLPGISV